MAGAREAMRELLRKRKDQSARCAVQRQWPDDGALQGRAVAEKTGQSEKEEANPTYTWLYLVRHGESFSNVERRHSAVPPGPGLTARGRAQALYVADLLLAKEPPPDLLLTSTLLRAKETCHVLATLLGTEPEVVPDLREIGGGEWEGVPHAALIDRVGYSAWERDPELQVPPGGERLSEAAARMVRALTTAARQHPGRSMAAFSHFDPMVGFYLAVTQSPWSAYPTLPLCNAGVLTFNYDTERDRWQFLAEDYRAGEVAQPTRVLEDPA